LGANDIHVCYPVPGAVGKYSQVLPHITLDAAELPWARLLKGPPEGTPWVALLLFREGELPGDPDAVGAVTVSTVRQLLDGDAGAGLPPAIGSENLFTGEAELACRSMRVPANVPELGVGAAVVANRFPSSAGGRHVAHLVSLEGFEDYLGGTSLIYLEQWGIFDTGYVSAFSLGRTLAMADAPFRIRLLEFRQAARRAARRLVAHP
jgi:hypothetical protein